MLEQLIVCTMTMIGVSWVTAFTVAHPKRSLDPIRPQVWQTQPKQQLEVLTSQSASWPSLMLNGMMQ